MQLRPRAAAVQFQRHPQQPCWALMMAHRPAVRCRRLDCSQPMFARGQRRIGVNKENQIASADRLGQLGQKLMRGDDSRRVRRQRLLQRLRRGNANAIIAAQSVTNSDDQDGRRCRMKSGEGRIKFGHDDVPEFRLNDTHSSFSGRPEGTPVERRKAPLRDGHTAEVIPAIISGTRIYARCTWSTTSPPGATNSTCIGICPTACVAQLRHGS